jgi:transposase
MWATKWDTVSKKMDKEKRKKREKNEKCFLRQLKVERIHDHQIILSSCLKDFCI